jgi:plasmid stabilization system protein ParE
MTLLEAFTELKAWPVEDMAQSQRRAQAVKVVTEETQRLAPCVCKGFGAADQDALAQASASAVVAALRRGCGKDVVTETDEHARGYLLTALRRNARQMARRRDNRRRHEAEYAEGRLQVVEPTLDPDTPPGLEPWAHEAIQIASGLVARAGARSQARREKRLRDAFEQMVEMLRTGRSVASFVPAGLSREELKRERAKRYTAYSECRQAIETMLGEAERGPAGAQGSVSADDAKAVRALLPRLLRRQHRGRGRR